MKAIRVVSTSALLLCALATAPRAAVTVTDVTSTARSTLASIKTSDLDTLIKLIDTLAPGEQAKFFSLLQQSLSITPNGYDVGDIAKVERLLIYFNKTEILMDPLTLQQNPCFKTNAPKNGLCYAAFHGAAFAMKVRSEGTPCWKALEAARTQHRNFRDGLQEFYARNSGADDTELSQCRKPATPTRCQLAFCFAEDSAGVQVRPAASLGLAVPLGHPEFGFKDDSQSVSLQATAGISVRAFALDDRVGAQLVFGLANGVGSDQMSTQAALVSSLGVGVWGGIIGFSVLALTNPTNADTGFGLSFAVDVVAVKDQLGDSK